MEWMKMAMIWVMIWMEELILQIWLTKISMKMISMISQEISTKDNKLNKNRSKIKSFKVLSEEKNGCWK